MKNEFSNSGDLMIEISNIYIFKKKILNIPSRNHVRVTYQKKKNIT